MQQQLDIGPALRHVPTLPSRPKGFLCPREIHKLLQLGARCELNLCAPESALKLSMTNSVPLGGEPRAENCLQLADLHLPFVKLLRSCVSGQQRRATGVQGVHEPWATNEGPDNILDPLVGHWHAHRGSPATVSPATFRGAILGKPVGSWPARMEPLSNPSCLPCLGAFNDHRAFKLSEGGQELKEEPI